MPLPYINMQLISIKNIQPAGHFAIFLLKLDKQFKSYGNLNRAPHFLKITVTLRQTIIS